MLQDSPVLTEAALFIFAPTDIFSNTTSPIQYIAVRDDGGNEPSALIVIFFVPSERCLTTSEAVIANTQSFFIDKATLLDWCFIPFINRANVPVPEVVYPVFVLLK